MYINTITIQGFKSYRDQVAVDPFSPGHNVIVGRNGSGKSNFFSAIRFVLSDQYTQMGREERQRLLHEGTSTSTTLAAYVEIVFDNTDGRFPTALPEVRLRRTIGLKKDEYSLDKKSVTKAEVNNLLESAGFSKSNPYYIVPQGRITHLTNMSDKERLNLLKEVAGTKVYEQKRSESTKIMDETSAKREKITELLTAIEDRLTELEQEKEELKEYQEKDRDRRCLEYALHNRELSDVTGALDQLENEHKADQHNINVRQQEFNEQQEAIQKHEETLTTARHSLSTTTIALRQYETEMADLVRTRTEIECVIADFKAAQEGGEERRQEMVEELEGLEERIQEANERLQTLEDELDRRIAEERDAKEALDNTQAQLNVLYAKQGRSQQFTTQAQRDKYLNDEIKSLKAHEKAQQKQVDDLTKEVGNAKSHLSEVVERSKAEADEEEERRETMRSMGEEIVKTKKEVDDLQEQRKELWREDGKLGASVANDKAEMEKAERGLAGVMDRDTNNGLNSVKHVARRLNLAGVYGPLYDLFEVSEKYKQAVEVTAGTSLFHVVVDNDDTATKILEVMNKEKLGRVTFMPLNRLRTVNIQMPKAGDAVPLMSKLKFDATYNLAFEQVFGRTIVCEDLATAAQYTRSHGVNAVTPDGDRVDRKGALTGGFHDSKKSRIDLIKTLKKWSKTYEEDNARYREVKEGVTKIDQTITQKAGHIQVLEARRRQAMDVRSRFSNQSQWTKKEEDQIRSRVESLEQQLASAEAEFKAATVRRTADEDELKTPMRQQLTNDEVKNLEALTKASEEQKKTLVQKSLARSKASSERSKLDIELTENLRRKRDELRVKVDQVEGDAGTGSLQAGEVELRDTELRQLIRSIEILSDQLKGQFPMLLACLRGEMGADIAESEEQVDKLTAEIAEVTAKLDEVQNEQLEAGRAMLRMTKNNERYLAKRQTLSSRRDECQNAIRDLGVLPEEAYNKYTEARADKLVKRLHKVNDSLKKFAHVNKKAFEQYNNFTKQRDEHLERREELDASAASIQELIETLDQRKDEAIERTFKQVSKYFEEVFETLVPAGKGVLVMQKKADGYIDEESEDPNPAREKSEIDNYTGVSIRVSFNSKADEGQRIQQLSGGQKSLVALATVFAIQKCDPAPFYLFDEIDANLDAQYRTAVAAMIHTLSDSAQFVTTTFRSEMLAQADKFYGVYFDRQKVSSIATIERDEAYEFVENAAQ